MAAIDVSTSWSRRGQARDAGWAISAERAKAFRRARRHTRFVRLLRLLLPVCAIASVGFYFTGYLSSARISIQVPQGTVTASVPTFDGSNLKMENPKYEGFTAGGGKFSVTAKTGYQDFRNPSVFRLETIAAHLAQPDEQWAHLVSDDGVYDSKKELLTLAGNIKVTSSNGMTVHLKTAEVQVKPQIVTSKDPVIVEMSNGSTVESERMSLDAKAKEVVFEGSVRSRLVRSEPPPAQGAAPRAEAAEGQAR
jgi:lipopolysaccharide export system protein LptC